MPEKLEIHIVSDSTGDTAARVARAATHQYEDVEIDMIRHARVQTEEQLARALEDATGRPAVVFYTLVDSALREAIVDLARQHRIVTLDVLSPALHAITTASGTQATMLPGRTAPFDAQYFRRIAAIEFAVKHDDGRGSDDLNHAEIVLVGVSRTSKTPTSMHLGYLGYMAANVPIVRGIDPPVGLFSVDPWKVVGLTIDAERLADPGPASAGAGGRRQRPVCRPVGDLRRAGAGLDPSPAARLPGDRRLGPGDRRGRRPRCRAGQRAPARGPRGYPGLM